MCAFQFIVAFRSSASRLFFNSLLNRDAQPGKA